MAPSTQTDNLPAPILHLLLPYPSSQSHYNAVARHLPLSPPLQLNHRRLPSPIPTHRLIPRRVQRRLQCSDRRLLSK
jgi:hypothetical protein